ncbi:MAG: CXXX repeat peptide maturase [Candidatus Omnitrophota bacterium]
MIKYLIAILDKHATSFCYYDNPSYGESKPAFIPLEELETIIDFAVRNKISVNFLYGNHKPPASYDERIESVNHIKIMPLKLRPEINDGIFVINTDDLDNISRIEDNTHLNLILRLERKKLPEFADIFRSLTGKFKRLNLCLLNIEDYSDDDLNEYGNQLKKIEAAAADMYKAGNTVEINFISDRIMLHNMNNCDAGIKHLTAAPNGKLYLCPGFYFHHEENSLVATGQDIEIKNSQLLKLSHAPVCRNCDAYHCKRCVFLNQKTTLELNTPSHQQCVASHLERNTSMRLLDALKPDMELFQTFTPIPEIPYLDPYEILDDISNHKIEPVEGEKLISGLLSKPLEKLSTQELLYRIYKLDKEFLIRLKNIE